MGKILELGTLSSVLLTFASWGWTLGAWGKTSSSLNADGTKAGWKMKVQYLAQEAGERKLGLELREGREKLGAKICGSQTVRARSLRIGEMDWEPVVGREIIIG